MQRFKMGFSDYIQALEQERRKIQVFPKELPLSLELVTQGTYIPFLFFLYDYELKFVFLLSGFVLFLKNNFGFFWLIISY